MNNKSVEFTVELKVVKDENPFRILNNEELAIAETLLDRPLVSVEERLININAKSIAEDIDNEIINTLISAQRNKI